MTRIILSNGQIVNVPEGADTEAYRRYAEALAQRRAGGKKQTTPRRRQSSTRSRSPRAMRTTVPVISGYEAQHDQVGQALGELANKVNGKDQGGDVDCVLVNAGGRFYGVVEV